MAHAKALQLRASGLRFLAFPYSLTQPTQLARPSSQLYHIPVTAVCHHKKYFCSCLFSAMRHELSVMKRLRDILKISIIEGRDEWI